MLTLLFSDSIEMSLPLPPIRRSPSCVFSASFVSPPLVSTITSRPLRALLRLNPMTPFIVTYQDLIFFGHLPGVADTLLMIAYAFVSMTAGFVVFDRLRDVLAEAI